MGREGQLRVPAPARVEFGNAPFGAWIALGVVGHAHRGGPKWRRM